MEFDFWLFDFYIYHAAGQALILGQSPYTIFGFFSPFPFAILFVPFALFPVKISYLLYLTINLVLLRKVAKKNFIWALLSFPIFFTLLVGQVDLLIALVAALVGPLALPLLLIKPQLGFVLFPWMLKNSSFRKFAWGIGLTIILIGLAFVLSPNWVSEWLNAMPKFQFYSERDTTLYWFLSSESKVFWVNIISIPILIVGAFMVSRRVSWSFLFLFSPITAVYTASIMAQWIGPVAMLASWIALIVVGGDVHNGSPMFLIALVILMNEFDPVSLLKSGYLNKKKRDY